MRGARSLHARRWLAAAAAGVLCAGCPSDPSPKKAEPVAEQPAEPGESKPVVDRKIESAMAAARASAQAQPGASGGQGAPPADGILGVEGAARELPPGSGAQIVLGSAGAEPRVTLGFARANAAPAGSISISYRSGGSVMPTVEVEFKAKTTGGAAAGAGGAGASDGLLTHFGFTNARPAADQPGRLPENARSEIAKLKGSSVDFVGDPRGAVVSQRVLVSGNNAVLEPFVQGSAVALASFSLPYPNEPVGVGAYWMVKSRELAEGAEVVAYRMVKLTGLEGGVAQLTVNTKRYLVTPQLSLQGLPPHRVRQFQSEGSATLSLAVGSPYPRSAEVKEQFGSLVVADDRPQQPIPVQSELTAHITLGG
ncbi:MAG: hypothetical protein RL033_2774 [Pseudomonadota bacterium]